MVASAFWRKSFGGLVGEDGEVLVELRRDLVRECLGRSWLLALSQVGGDCMLGVDLESVRSAGGTFESRVVGEVNLSCDPVNCRVVFLEPGKA